MEIKDELVLNGMTWSGLNTKPLVRFKPDTVTHLCIILIDGQVMHRPYRKNIHVMHFILQL